MTIYSGKMFSLRHFKSDPKNEKNNFSKSDNAFKNTLKGSRSSGKEPIMSRQANSILDEMKASTPQVSLEECNSNQSTRSQNLTPRGKGNAHTEEEYNKSNTLIEEKLNESPSTSSSISEEEIPVETTPKKVRWQSTKFALTYSALETQLENGMVNKDYFKKALAIVPIKKVVTDIQITQPTKEASPEVDAWNKKKKAFRRIMKRLVTHCVTGTKPRAKGVRTIKSDPATWDPKYKDLPYKPFRGDNQGIMEMYVAVEKHKDGKIHFHVALCVTVRQDIRNPKFFDLDRWHPNVQTLPSSKDWAAFCSYMTKEDKTTGINKMCELANRVWSCTSQGDAYVHAHGKTQDIKLLWESRNAVFVPKEETVLEDKPWSNQCLEILKERNTRHVHWIISHKGNDGKSVFTRYCRINQIALICSDVGTGGDFATVLGSLMDESPWWKRDAIVFDFPRTKKDHTTFYTKIEEYKNGEMTATKYQGGGIVLERGGAVIVFANFYPEIDRFSLDRWKLWESDGETLTAKTFDDVKAWKRECMYKKMKAARAENNMRKQIERQLNREEGRCTEEEFFVETEQRFEGNLKVKADKLHKGDDLELSEQDWTGEEEEHPRPKSERKVVKYEGPTMVKIISRNAGTSPFPRKTK
jgi:hypothetical protein